MNDGIEAIREEAQRLVALAANYPSGQTKALLLRTAADLFEHVQQCDDEEARRRDD